MEGDYQISINNVWQNDNEHDDVIAFWKSLNALPGNVNPKDRANQLVFVARDRQGQVIGVTTAQPGLIKRLNNNYFFNFRTLIHPTYRLPGLVDKLCVETRDFLEGLYKNKKTECIGLITLVENEHLKQYRREAVWPSTGFMYIGKSEAGHHLRVYYFEGARV